MMKQNIKFKPEICLLGIVPETGNKENNYLMLHILTAARMAWAQWWETEKVPTDEMLIHKILECAEMDRLTHRLKQKEEHKYVQSWNLFYVWLNNRKEAVE